MKLRSLTHLTDQALLRDLAALNSQDRATTADLLAHIAEVEERRLYLPKGYSSMHLYCVHELGMSEDIAYKRVRAARAARKFPAIFDALAEGRLHVTGVALLARHLTRANADELLSVAIRKTKAEIELLLAQRFPQADMPTLVQMLAPVVAAPELAPGPISFSAAPPVTASQPGRESGATTTLQLAPGPILFGAAQPGCAVDAPVPAHARLAPRSSGRFALQVTVDQETHDQLRYAQALLGHAVPSGDVAAVLKRALEALVKQLEQQKFAKCARSRPRGGSPKGRYVPAEVRRSVWQRDEGRCTFVSDGGTRCDARSRLEFDHADPVAKGGQATIGNLRLRCRAHNQYAAECAFGAGFMHEKRQGARRAARLATEARAPRSEAVAEPVRDLEVIPWLRQLGFGAREAERGAALCAHLGDAPLEQRVRVALQGLAPNYARRSESVISSTA